jgi:hypothetical protein
MLQWAKEFLDKNKGYSFSEFDNYFEIKDPINLYKIKVVKNDSNDSSENVSLFDLDSKRYKKTLSELERKFYKFIYNNKARFLPY